MKNARINEDGSMNVDMRDWYNFEKWKEKHYIEDENFKHPINTLIYNKVARANNRAYNQQKNNKLENYLMNMPIYLSKEELEKILKYYMYRR